MRHLAAICTEANAPQHDVHGHDHDRMAQTTTNVAPVGDNADPSSQIAPNANSSATQTSPHNARGATAAVFDTPELLEIILSELELRDL